MVTIYLSFVKSLKINSRRNPVSILFMTESILTISITGLLTGFFFSIPVTGPVSILITTNAFKGRLRYCNLVNIGASIATFTYVFLAVFSLSKLYHLYKPAIPYLFTIGSVFLLIMGFRIFRTKTDFEHAEDNSLINNKIKKKGKGGFYTGLIINFLNPALFISWLTSTFLVISLVSSLGFNTGGLNKAVIQSVKEIGIIDTGTFENTAVTPVKNPGLVTAHGISNYSDAHTGFSENFHFLISLLYALFISAGSITWFYILAFTITRFRRYLNFNYVLVFIKSMGVILCIIGLYFGYLAVTITLLPV
jgi:threonine/homoserine/homoserine lactone efflux protein